MSHQITTPLSSFSSKLDGRSGNISLGLNPLLPRLLVQRKPPLGDCIGFSHGEPGTNSSSIPDKSKSLGRSLLMENQVRILHPSLINPSPLVAGNPRMAAAAVDAFFFLLNLVCFICSAQSASTLQVSAPSVRRHTCSFSS